MNSNEQDPTDEGRCGRWTYDWETKTHSHFAAPHNWVTGWTGATKQCVYCRKLVRLTGAALPGRSEAARPEDRAASTSQGETPAINDQPLSNP